MKHLKR